MMDKLLRLNLQHFAEEGEGTTEEVKEVVETNTEGEPDNTAETKTFTQEDLDRIVSERLAREQKKREEAVKQAEEAAERKKLEESNEYKALYEKAVEDLEAFKADALIVQKDSLLKNAGYSEDQVERYRKYVTGETAEELQASLDVLKADVPPKPQYADPSSFNGAKTKAEQTDKEDIGRSAFDRIRNKIGY